MAIYSACSDLSTRKLRWASNDGTVQTAAAVAVKASNYQGWQGPGHRYYCNPEAPRLGFYI